MIPAPVEAAKNINVVVAGNLNVASLVSTGKAGVDLMLNSSKDWRGIAPYATYSATFRAIENGCSMVRCTSEGLSIAVDYQGRPVAAADYFTSDEQIMIADLPMKGLTTIYAQIGRAPAMNPRPILWSRIGLLEMCLKEFSNGVGFTNLKTQTSMANSARKSCRCLLVRPLPTLPLYTSLP